MKRFKVGDTAFSFFSGFHVIEECSYTDRIMHGGFIYQSNGKFNGVDLYPSLLTVEEAAKLGYHPPKKKVTKEFVRWVNTYSSGDCYHLTQQSALKDREPYCIATFEVRGTYEVEE